MTRKDQKLISEAYKQILTESSVNYPDGSKEEWKDGKLVSQKIAPHDKSNSKFERQDMSFDEFVKNWYDNVEIKGGHTARLHLPVFVDSNQIGKFDLTTNTFHTQQGQQLKFTPEDTNDAIVAYLKRCGAQRSYDPWA